MKEMRCKAIGEVVHGEEGSYIQVFEEYRDALEGLDGFSHLQVLYWLHEMDREDYRTITQTPKPYTKAPDNLGIFATRSPVRPNPIGLSAMQVLSYDQEKGRILVAYADAFAGTPVLDIKPYTPSVDKVRDCQVPQWCAHWPGCQEESGAFDWSAEFLF